MTTTPQEHSSLVGGSTAARRIGCPRSYHLEQLVPLESGSSTYAQEGTTLHELLGHCLERDIEPRDLIPYTFTSEKDGGWSFTVDANLWEEKGETALRAFDTFVAAQEERIGAEMRFLVEKRVQFPGIEGAFGTADIIARCGNEVLIMDWKMGRGIVPARENKQLLFYAVAALHSQKAFFEHMTLTAETPVTMAIIQPALETGIDVWQTDLLRLHHYEVELLAAIAEIRNDGMNARVQDGPWCKFARCKAICPLHIGAAAKLAGQFDRLQAALAGPKVGIDDSGGFVLSCPSCGRGWRDTEDKPCECLELEELQERYADLLDLVDMVEDWCREVREQAHEQANRGMAIPGWVLEPGRKGPRKWAIDEDQVLETFTGPEFGLDPDVLAPRKVLTLPQLEKILKRDGKAIPDGFATQSEPSTTRLVRAENATEIVEPTAAKAVALAEKLMRL